MISALLCAAISFLLVCVGTAMCAYGVPRGRDHRWFSWGVVLLFAGLIAFGASIGAML